MAEVDDVAALGHGHAQRYHLLALKAHLHSGRIDVTAGDGSDVTQLDVPARSTANRHGAQTGHGFKLTFNPDLNHVLCRLQTAGAFHCVLLTQLRHHRIQIQT